MSKVSTGGRRSCRTGPSKTLPTWWIKFSKNGQVFRESSKSSKHDDAKRLLKRRVGEVADGRFAGLGPERIRFSELAEGVLDDYRNNERSSLSHVERRLRLHELPAFESIRAADLGTAHIEKYIGDRRRQRASNGSINRELAIVKRAFRLALESHPPKAARAPKLRFWRRITSALGFWNTTPLYPVTSGTARGDPPDISSRLLDQLPTRRTDDDAVGSGGPHSQSAHPLGGHYEK